MDIKQEKLMTDGFVAEVNPKSGLQANANLEGGEYIKTPDGSVAQVLGERHTKGGVNLVLPNMTTVLSDTKDLTLEKKQVKQLKKDFGLEATTKMTYADVLDKYAKKIGLSKLLDEQEEAFSQLKKVTENALSEGSLNVNNSFLQKKIYGLQGGIAEKQTAMGNMFEAMFAEQQEAKGEDVETEVVGELTEQQVMKFGGCVGCVDNLKQIATKHGYTPQQAFELLDKAGKLPKFANGGVFKVGYTNNKNKDKAEVQQSPNETAHGDITAQGAIDQLYISFPLALSSDKYKDLIDIKDGKPILKEGLKLNQENTLIKQLQKDMDVTERATANYIIKDTTGRFSKEDKAGAEQYLKDYTFVEDKTSIRGFDGRLGNYTSKQILPTLDLVTPKDRGILQELGKTTIGQLTDEDILKLSPESQKRINEIKPTLTNGEDFLITNFDTPLQPNEVAPPTTPPGTEVVDDLSIQEQKKKYPRLFFTPDQGLPPPRGLQSEHLEQIELGRLDPLRIGIEDQLKKLGDSRGFVASQMESLPPSQRAAMLSNLVATASSVESDAITKANQTNAQNLAQTEQFNLTQGDKETVANAESRLNYEQRALRGLSNTQNEIHNYFMANREIYLNNYKEQIRMNTLDQLFPDVSIDNFGIGAQYDPSYNFQIDAPNTNYNEAVQRQRAAQAQEVEDAKKKKKED